MSDSKTAEGAAQCKSSGRVACPSAWTCRQACGAACMEVRRGSSLAATFRQQGLSHPSAYMTMYVSAHGMSFCSASVAQVYLTQDVRHAIVRPRQETPTPESREATPALAV